MADYALALALCALPREDGGIYLFLRLDHSGDLIRVVGPGADLGVSDRCAQLDGGKLPEPLDVLRIGLKERLPPETQPENWVVDRSLRWVRCDIESGAVAAGLVTAAEESAVALARLIDPEDGGIMPRAVDRSIWILMPDECQFWAAESTDGEWLACRVILTLKGQQVTFPIADDDCLERMTRAGPGVHGAAQLGYEAKSPLLLVLTFDDFEDPDGRLEVFVVGVVHVAALGETLPVDAIPPVLGQAGHVSEQLARQVAHQEAAPAKGRSTSGSDESWTATQIAELETRWNAGASIGDLCRTFRRRRLAVMAKLTALGYDPLQSAPEIPHLLDRFTADDRNVDVNDGDAGHARRPPTTDSALLIDLAALPGEAPRTQSNPIIRAVLRTSRRAYAPWTAVEDWELLRLTRGGSSVDEIAALLQRQPGAVRSRLKKCETPVVEAKTRAIRETPPEGTPGPLSQDSVDAQSVSASPKTSYHVAAEHLSTRLGCRVTSIRLARFVLYREPHERHVLEHRYGGAGFEPLPVSAVSEKLMLSEDRVIETESLALDALRAFVDGWESALQGQSGFSRHDGSQHVSSEDLTVETTLTDTPDKSAIAAGRDPALLSSSGPAPSYQGRGGGSSNVRVSVEDVFGGRAKFARRIIEISAMDECGRRSRYVNLNLKRKTVAQIHSQPRENGIALVLRSRSDDRPATRFAEIPMHALMGYKGGSNMTWLDGTGNTFNVEKGPAIAFLIPDAVAQLDDDAPEWRDIARLLEHAKTLE